MTDRRDGQPTVPDYASAPGDARGWRGSSFVPGAVIGDVWLVEKTLGKGGMGSVYRCHNRHAPRILAAIKLLDPAFQYHPEAKARFLREAEILYTIDHPNVVKVSNVHLEAQPPYLEMEFVDGLSLEDELAQFGPIPFEVALDRAKQLASALRYLHRKNIFHRDIKPQNILTRRDGTLKLVDFGLAIEAGGDRITQQDTVNFGTVSYCPPEWGRRAELDPAHWDLYALGVVLYEMLTGTVAFPVTPDADPRRQMIQVMSDKQRVEALDPGPRFEPNLREVVRRLTVKDPAGRITDEKELLAALEQVDIGWRPEASGKRPPVRTLASERSARRHELIGLVGMFTAIVAGGLAVGSVVALAVLFWVGMSPSTRDVELLVGGVPADAPVDVRLAEQPPSRVEGLHHRFLRVPVGDVRAEWAVGPGCKAGCAADCPAWCATGSGLLALDEGSGEARLVLEVRPPAPRVVVLRAPEVSVGVARLGDRQAPFVDGVARFEGVEPGSWSISAAAGDCPPGCVAGCGDGCNTVAFEHVVANAAGADEVRVPLEMPRPPTAVEPAPVQRPRPEAVASGARVTRAAFARWLEQNPRWLPAAAIAEGRAMATYLSGWADGRPVDPVDAPVTHVPWTAADAFCAGRGGIASIDAPPLTWDDVPMMEWRRGADGERRWRRMDGDTSRKAVEPSESNAATGFRCAR